MYAVKKKTGSSTRIFLHLRGSNLSKFKVLMGIGRAVYESTNKAIFADFFPGEKSAGAVNPQNAKGWT